VSHFYVYAITFDQEVFGLYATHEDAQWSLDKQIAAGGPAWDACKVERWRISGEPERGNEEQ